MIFQQLHRTARAIREFAVRTGKCTSGNVPIVFSLSVPLLLGVSGLSLDYVRLLKDRAELQAAVDAAALDAAKGLSMADANEQSLQAVARNRFNRFFKAQMASRAKHPERAKVAAQVLRDPRGVRVTAAIPFEPTFGSYFGVSVQTVTASATATVRGQPNICVLGLSSLEDGTVQLDHQSKLTGKGCSVFSNSSSTEGIKVNEQAKLSANIICSHGGAQTNNDGLGSSLMVDCPSFTDPLAVRAAPPATACTFGSEGASPYSVWQSMELEPGVYCGGITVSGDAVATLKPGLYIIKGGPLQVVNQAKLIGTDVGFYLVGDNAKIMFDRGTTIDLAAAKTGPLAGMLFYEDRSQSTTGEHVILSNNARKLVGTIYLPRKSLKVDATSPVADQSAYTAIVARRIHLFGNSTVVLHTDYHLTDVPVPAGIKGVGQPVSLSR